MEREVAHAERQACRGHLGQRLGRNAMTRPFQVREQYIKGQVLCEAPCPGFVDADTEAEQGSYNQRVVGKEQIQVSAAPKATHLLRLPRLMLEAVSCWERDAGHCPLAITCASSALGVAKLWLLGRDQRGLLGGWA